MVRINLLPYQEMGQRREVIQHLLYFAIIMLVVIGVLFGIYRNRTNYLESLVADIARAESETKRYEAIAKQADELKKQLEILRTKLEVVRELDRDRSGAFRLLDTTMSMAVKEQMWLTFLGTKVKKVKKPPKRRSNKKKKEKEEPQKPKRPDVTITVRGIARTNQIVADFMENLENHSLYKNVRLVTSELTEIDQGEERDPLRLMRFEIESLESPPEIKLDEKTEGAPDDKAAKKEEGKA